jgi:membrane protein implicated in regulation of membrane protease activity
MLQIILFVLAGVLLILYIARRRARLRNEQSDK